MYTRFPELVPPGISHNPTADEIESGEWCPPHFRPDESNVTLLDSDLPVATQFANMTPEYQWLENDQQIVVAVSGTHPHDSSNPFYDDLRSLYGHFVAETNDRERATLREGRKWPQAGLDGSDAEIIVKGGDGLYLQSLARRNDIECLSTEPVSDKDILAVMRSRPSLKRAAIMYGRMRMLPQAYKSQQQDLPHDSVSVLTYFRGFVDERRSHHGELWAAKHLYSINYFSGPGCFNAIGLHLSKAHDLHSDNGHTLQGYDVAENPSKEVTEQIFRCTNSPIFHTRDIGKDELCEVQQVAVLINRLRDRRIAYLLADLGRRTVSYFWLSGPNHYEALSPGLRGMAAEQALSSRNMQAELGLLAVRASDMATHPSSLDILGLGKNYNS